MTIIEEIPRNSIKAMLIAAYYSGYETGRKGYKLDTDRVSNEWKRLEELLNGQWQYVKQKK